MKPKRIQRSRKKGWRKPEGAVIVDRTSRWGNTFKVSDPDIRTPERAVAAFQHKMDLQSDEYIQNLRDALGGKDLVCFCPLDQPCHADVLLHLANS